MSTDYNNIEALKNFAKILGKKTAISAAVWIVLYFIGQPFRNPESALALFSPLVGCLYGFAVGWWMGEDAVQDAGFTGLPLWSILVAAATLTIVPAELILKHITHWQANMGGFMMASSAIVMALGSSVWRASADN